MRLVILIGSFFVFVFGLVAQPQANFIADTTEGCAPLQVNFTNQSTAANQYQWRFGDGNGSSVSNPSHLYLNPGTYDVTLIVSASNGADSIVRQAYIVVHEVPVINYAFSDSIQCLLGDSISFMNYGDTANTYSWSFGDGNGSQSYEPTYTYSDTGFHQTTLMAESPYGCRNTFSLSQNIQVKANPDVDFLVDTHLVCQSGSPVNFSSLANASLAHYWDFGDGNIDSSAQNIQHIYPSEGSYDVSLSVEDSDGCLSTEEKTAAVQFHIPENLEVFRSTDSACSNQEVRFEVDSSWMQVEWYFGDGSTSNESHSSHRYLQAGTYQAGLIAYDSIGCKQVEVLDSIHLLQSPIADFQDTSKNRCLPFSIEFENTSVYASNYNWKIGNLSSSQENPTFSFTQGGNYDLELIAKNDICSDTLLIKDYLKLEDPLLEILVDDSLGCAPHQVVLSLNDPSRFKNVRWFFGNGDSAVSQKVNYTYELGGKFKPYVITETKSGCLDTSYYSAVIEVQDAQSVFNQPDTIFVCQSGSVNFEGQSIGGEFWQWDFGDGDSSQLANPSHFFDSAGVYEVNLLTKNTLGCYYRIEPYNVVVVTDPQLDFSMSRNNCPNFQMNFSANAPGAVEYLWDFGDGTTDSVANPIHYYSGPGYYNVSLSVVYPNACTVKRTRLNGVEMLPCVGNDSVAGGLSGPGNYTGTLNDTLEPIIACAPFQIQFNIPSDSLRNIWWDFGDGNTSTSFTPTHTYTSRGNYTLQLIVEDKNGHFDTVRNVNYVQVGQPIADFSLVTMNTCINSSVNFQNQSSNATNYEWKLGSAGSSNEINPSVRFNQAGNELIELTAIDDKGCMDQTYKNISLGSPNPYFDFDSQVCLGDTVNFASNLKGYNNYEWQIDGQSIIGDTVQFVPMDTGHFDVQILAYDTNNCLKTVTAQKQFVVSDPHSDFVFNDTAIACDYYDLNISNTSSGAEEYIWLLGNGDSLFEKEPTYRYRDSGSYNIQLLALKDGCMNASQLEKVVVNRANADFELQQNSNCLPVEVQFFDRSPAAVSWNWSFGDGDSSGIQNPQHTFTEKSKIQSLSIVDTNGCEAQLEKNALKIHRAVPSADRWEGCAPLTVQFADSSLNVVNYFWDFGDGNTSTQQFPSHTYTVPGTYDVKLITQSVEGCYDTTVLSSAVVAGSVAADFSSAATVNACAPQMAVFENHSKGATNYAWSFGDGNKSTKENPVHVYQKAGLFDVQLIADNGNSCVDTLLKQKRFNINTPEIAFSMTDSTFCGPQEVEFEDLSGRVASRKWFFGDGNTSTERTPTHFYDEVKNYTMSLVVTDTAGCIENLSKEIRIKRKPNASFSLDSTYGCVPASISFRNHSSELENPTYQWVLNQKTYKAFDTTLVFNSQGVYDVSLMVENANACSDTMTKANHLKIYEDDTNTVPTFNRLSRNEAADWMIEWEKNEDFNFNYYQLYRKNSNGTFEPYVQLLDQNQSKYQIAYRSDWASKQCFKIEVVKHCADPYEMEKVQAFCSIDLSATKVNDFIQLSWTKLENMIDKVSFEIYRKHRSEGNYELIAKVDTSSDSYIDSALLCPEFYVYRLKIVSNDETHSVYSDTAMVKPNDLLGGFEIDLKRITVVDDNQLLLEWENLGDIDAIARSLYVSKKNSRGSFSIVDELPLQSTSYIDVDEQISNRKMEYKVSLANRCKSKYQIEGSFASIWLELEQEGSGLKLRWTQVKGLNSGVKHYLIQKQNADGSWETIRKVSEDQLEIELNLED